MFNILIRFEWPISKEIFKKIARDFNRIKFKIVKISTNWKHFCDMGKKTLSMSSWPGLNLSSLPRFAILLQFRRIAGDSCIKI